MQSQALNSLTEIHGNILKDVIEIVNNSPKKSNATLMRLLVVSLAAFWEAFHEDLCREILPYHSKAHQNANRIIEKFHNPTPDNIDDLYSKTLGISRITECWVGNPVNTGGESPPDFRRTIERMMNLRHNVAHGKWSIPISPKDCENFLATILHLAIRTDDKVRVVFSISKRAINQK